jgi:flagellar motor switch protein FliN/FliY
MSTDTPAEAGDQDALADEWAAALAEQKPEGEAEAEDRSGALEASPRVEDASHVFQPLSRAAGAATARQDIDMILDIPVQLTVELGRTRIPIKHILQLAQGSVIELDALAGEPMDVLVNGCLIAQGEVVVVNDKFGIRLTDIVTPSERVRRLNRT